MVPHQCEKQEQTVNCSTTQGQVLIILKIHYDLKKSCKMEHQCAKLNPQRNMLVIVWF